MMAYQQGFVVSVIHNGKPVREFQGEDGIRSCILPFDSKYALRLKNNTCDHALVSVSIDSTPVVTGGEIVLEPGDGFDLERFVDTSEIGVNGRRFKFVRLDNPGVQDPTNIENGVVSVLFRPVRKRGAHYPRPKFQTDSLTKGPTKGVMRGATIGAETFCCASPVACCAAPGATVEGGMSDQRFGQSSDTFSWCGIPVEICIRLRGTERQPEQASTLFRVIGGTVHYCGVPLTGFYNFTQDRNGNVTLIPRE